MKDLPQFAMSVLVVLCACTFYQLKACTSWMVFSDLTKNNTNILHKNRDSRSRTIAVNLSPAGTARRWIALGSGKSTNSGINASGLAGAMNSGEKCTEPPTDKTKKSTLAILRTILESCDTAAEAVAKLKQLVKAGDYWHGNSGSIFFFCDSQEGYVCEITAKFCSVQRYTCGYTVRANIWQNPNMYERSRNSLQNHLNSSARAYMAIHLLNKALDKHRKITMPDIFDLSRHHQLPEEFPKMRSICFRYTNSNSSMEIDRQYPKVLSTMYVTIGHPRHTVFVPIPLCTEKLHPAMSDLRWSKTAWERFDRLTLAAPIPEAWLNFEQQMFKTYAIEKEKARKLLNSGKQKEAVKLLNAAAAKIWDEAAKLLEIPTGPQK